MKVASNRLSVLATSGFSNMFFRHRHLLVGLSFGVLALASYCLEASLIPDFPVSVSHFFIIFAALSAGPEAALIAFTVGSFPSTLFDEGNFRYTVQSAIIVSAILAHRRWFTDMPAYFTVLLTWLLILVPFHLAFPETHWNLNVPSFVLGLQAMFDVFLTALASTLLFIPWAYETILAKPYQPNRERLFAAVSGTIFSLIALCGLFITPSVSVAHSYQAATVFDLGLILVFLVLVVGTATFGARWLDVTVLQISPHETRTRLSGSFSSTDLLPSSPAPRRNNAVLTDSLMDLPTAAVIPPGVCALDGDGKVLFANQRFRELIQTSEKDLSKKSLLDIPMDNQIRSALEDFSHKVKGGEKLSEEFKLNEMPEKLRYFSISIEPYEVGPEEPTGQLLTLQEITDRRTIEFHLLEAQKMKNLGSVMGSIAHAFNNSLTAIIGRASFALRTHDSEAQKIALTEIKTQAQKAGELVWKLLDFSEGKPTPFKALSLGELVTERLELLRKLLGDSFQLRMIKEESPELWISGDPNLLMQVLTELITNAKDAYRDNVGEIELTICSETMDEDIAKLHPGAKPGDYARLTITDYGCGMSPEMISQAFAPLVSTKTRAGNSGLGLSIVYAILRAHDGFLSVESFPEKGTTISVYIPLCEEAENSLVEQAESETDPVEEPATEAEPQANILVVEDEPEVRDLIGKMLEMLGYQVTTCGSAEEATNIYETNEYDLLLVDYMMPYMSGLDLIDGLKEEHSEDETRFILMSGCGNVQVKDPEAISLLPKPFDIDTLGDTVNAVLTQSGE